MIPSVRLLVTAPLHEGARIKATPAQAHYLGTVMRRSAGGSVRLFNGADGEFQARIAELRRDHALFAVEHRLRPQASELDLWLAFAVLKRDATDVLVQKATELGASVLLPVFTERTNAARVNQARLAAIVAEAAEQSERLTVPRIEPPRGLTALLDTWPEERRLVAAIERATTEPPVVPASRPAGLLIGPEGGFTPTELDVLRRHPFVVTATLGPRILRAETAAIVGLALLQAHPNA